MGKYVSVEKYREISGSTELNDEKIKAWIASAEDYVEQTTKRAFVRETKTITLSGEGGQVLHLNNWLYEVHTVEIDGQIIPEHSYTYSPYFIGLNHGVFPRRLNNVKITATFGRYSEPDSAVVEAIVRIASWRDDTVTSIPVPEDMIYQSQSMGDYSYSLRPGVNTGDAFVDRVLRLNKALTGGIT